MSGPRVCVKLGYGQGGGGATPLARRWGSSEAEQQHCKLSVGGSNPSPSTTILSGHQPTYLPGIVVFNKIALSDKFMFVGHCDYQHRSWHNHNFILGHNGPLKLIVPVHKAASINETKPFDDGHWRHTHLQSIYHTYKKRPFFKDYYPELEAALLMPAKSLSDLNIGLINVLMGMLEIDTPTFRSEKYRIQKHKTEMLVEMCYALHANHYLSSPGETYVDEEQMNGFAHSFQQFEHPIYDQSALGQGSRPRAFTPNLSVIDLLFCCGPRSAQIVRECGHVG